MDSRYSALGIGITLLAAIALLGVVGGAGATSWLADGAARAPLGAATPTATFTPEIVLRMPLIGRSYTFAPVTGSVLFEGGACCVGGQAGDTIQIDAAFEAASPYAAVTDIRVASRYGGGCLTQAELSHSAWEPFAPTRSFPVTLVVNWVGFYVTVQYRDGAGHVSPVYCDDISVAGMPPSP